MNDLNYRKADWLLIGLYLLLICFGWMNIYSSSVGEDGFIFSLKQKYIMDLIWMGSAIVIGCVILFAIPSKVYPAISWPLYAIVVLMLIAVAFIGVEVNGSKSWFAIGPFRLQPAEFSKISTAIVLASVMSKHDFRFSNLRDLVKVGMVLAIPMMAILLEKETGSMLVYVGFLLVFYREGMSGWVLVLGLFAILFFILTLILKPFVTLLILMGLVGLVCAHYLKRLELGAIITALVIIPLAFLPKILHVDDMAEPAKISPAMWIVLVTVPLSIWLALRGIIKRNNVLRNSMLCYLLGVCLIFSAQFAFDNILKDHQRGRIEVLLGMKDDPRGIGYNVRQSMVAIGSGGLTGKGFLNGTQTRFDFVPEQSTDFIFCTIGEEWGFLGTTTVLLVYLTIILRLMSSAEKQKDKFARIYGYCVASCLLMHVMINICMTIGLMPVIGIPLPLLSYGGSSMWAFTILLFIYLRLDLERWKQY